LDAYYKQQGAFSVYNLFITDSLIFSKLHFAEITSEFLKLQRLLLFSQCCFYTEIVCIKALLLLHIYFSLKEANL